MNLTITPNITNNYNSQNCKRNNSQQNFGELSARLMKHAKESDLFAECARLKRDKTIDALLGHFNALIKKEGKSTKQLEDAGYSLAFYPKYAGGSPMSCKLVNRDGDALFINGREVAVNVSRDFEEPASKEFAQQLDSFGLLSSK